MFSSYGGLGCLSYCRSINSIFHSDRFRCGANWAQKEWEPYPHEKPYHSTEITFTTTSWWYTYPFEKYSWQLGWWFPIYGKIKVMFQTTNQLLIIHHYSPVLVLTINNPYSPIAPTRYCSKAPTRLGTSPLSRPLFQLNLSVPGFFRWAIPNALMLQQEPPTLWGFPGDTTRII